MALHVAERVADLPRIPVMQHGQDQVFLALEMLVERRLGDADGGENLAEADRLEAAATEQVAGGVASARRVTRKGRGGFSASTGRSSPCPPARRWS
ncbi:MAG TPA: hypothetical protein PKC49_08905 [Phycisphaerae bacterium]|nr:hypothetical protein [Phycisphaerae bacterium]